MSKSVPLDLSWTGWIVECFLSTELCVEVHCELVTVLGRLLNLHLASGGLTDLKVRHMNERFVMGLVESLALEGKLLLLVHCHVVLNSLVFF